MCRNKFDISASAPRPRSRPSATSSATTSGVCSSNLKPSTASSASSVISHTSIQDSLPDRPVLFSFPEIRAATNNFLLKRHSSSSSSSSWRCMLRHKDVLVFQRELRDGDAARAVSDRLSCVARSHHKSLVRLVGASLLPGGNSIFLAYEFVPGASLADCLRNPRNPGYSALPTWTSRMQVVTDVAEGLEYIHRHSGTSKRPELAIHNRIKSSSIMVHDDPKIHAKICHFGTAELTGEIDEDERRPHPGCEIEGAESRRWRNSRRRPKRIEGTRGYMAPEVIAGGAPTQQTDVFAFGVLMLETLSGEEPMRYRYHRNRLESVSLIDTARDVMGSDEENWDQEERQRRLRRWMDRRLNDSFPVDVVEKMLALALECVQTEAGHRPAMEKVAGRTSQLQMMAAEWESKKKMPADFTVSLAPR